MNRLLQYAVVLIVLEVAREASGADRKWVWGSSRGSQSDPSQLSGNRDRYNNNRASEVYEEVDEDGEDFEEQRPGGGGGYGRPNGLRGTYYPSQGGRPFEGGNPLLPQGGGPLPLPGSDGRPFPGAGPGGRPFPGPGPAGRPNPPPQRPPGYFPRPPPGSGGPGDGDPLINDPTYFEKCSCQPAFNCRQPALIFGSCDVDKQYCCEKFATPDVLVGPGGPIDPIHRRPPPQGGPPPPIYSRAKARQ